MQWSKLFNPLVCSGYDKTTMTEILIIVDTLWTMSKKTGKDTEESKIIGKIETIHNIAIFRWARILKSPAKLIWFDLFGFYGIWTIVGYLISNSIYTHKQFNLA